MEEQRQRDVERRNQVRQATVSCFTPVCACVWVLAPLPMATALAPRGMDRRLGPPIVNRRRSTSSSSSSTTTTFADGPNFAGSNKNEDRQKNKTPRHFRNGVASGTAPGGGRRRMTSSSAAVWLGGLGGLESIFKTSSFGGVLKRRLDILGSDVKNGPPPQTRLVLRLVIAVACRRLR